MFGYRRRHGQRAGRGCRHVAPCRAQRCVVPLRHPGGRVVCLPSPKPIRANGATSRRPRRAAGFWH